MSANTETISAELSPSRIDVVRLVQVTDSHIYAEPDECLLGLNTRESFEAVCERVNCEEWRPDALLATGDLAQDASPEAYLYLADYFEKMGLPCFWIPGNHDKPEVMSEYLCATKISPAKQILIGDWQIIMLDSSVPGKVHGEINESQMTFLLKCLDEGKDKHNLVVLHHQPFPVGSDWLDGVGLKNTEPFLKIIKENKQIKGVLWGHIHQEYQKMDDGVNWIASPSSCVQFKPGAKDFAADAKSPGYRYLNLFSDGRIESVVHRVDSIDYTVDYSINGY